MPIEPSPAVLRAGDLLAQLVEQPGRSFTVSELARRVGCPRATCDAILQSLAHHRLVTRREEDRRYELGPGGIALGEAARTANPWLGAARVEAERLARALGACVSVCVHDGRSARVVESFDFGPLFAVRARVGQAIPLVPPFGAVFVAWNTEDAERWIAAAGADLDAGEREHYRGALEAVRRRGYAASLVTPGLTGVGTAEAFAAAPESEDARRAREELIRSAMHSDYLAVDLDVEGKVRVGQISAPVFDRAGSVASSILVPGPNRDITPLELRELAAQVVEAAHRATEAAGGREPV